MENPAGFSITKKIVAQFSLEGRSFRAFFINYFNIVSISFITITFTIIWSYFIDKINLELLIGGLAFAGSLFMTVLTLIFSKIKNIKEQIKNL